MKDIKELGRLYKEKNPGIYDDLSDEEVGRGVLAKFPEDYSDFYLVKPSVQSKKFGKLEEKAEPDSGVITNWWRRRKVESLGKLQTEINVTGAALTESIKHETLLRQHHLSQCRVEAEEQMAFESRVQQHHESIARSKLSLQLIEQASRQGMSVETLSEVRRKLELDRLELDRQWQEAEQQLKAGFIFQLQAHQHLALVTEYIGKLYDRAEQLSRDNKSRELKLVEEHIAFMEADFRERQKGLLQSVDRKEISRGGQGTEPSGDSGPSVETDTSLR